MASSNRRMLWKRNAMSAVHAMTHAVEVPAGNGFAASAVPISIGIGVFKRTGAREGRLNNCAAGVSCASRSLLLTDRTRARSHAHRHVAGNDSMLFAGNLASRILCHVTASIAARSSSLARSEPRSSVRRAANSGSIAGSLGVGTDPKSLPINARHDGTAIGSVLLRETGINVFVVARRKIFAFITSMVLASVKAQITILRILRRCVPCVTSEFIHLHTMSLVDAFTFKAQSSTGWASMR